MEKEVGNLEEMSIDGKKVWVVADELPIFNLKEPFFNSCPLSSSHIDLRPHC